ncbi:MAG: hypothetical protein LC754_13650 [Acidobacteria bacterium]|nr:hypothetical protein [Acidobacteriota bacterium]
MNFFKLILALVVLFLAVLGAFALFGLVAVVIKYLFFFGLLALAGLVGYKALKKTDAPLLEANPFDRELERAQRSLEEIKRRQLSK